MTTPAIPAAAPPVRIASSRQSGFVRQPMRLAQPHGHHDAGERADAHKARVTEAQLAGNADRQVQRRQP